MNISKMFTDTAKVREDSFSNILTLDPHINIYQDLTYLFIDPDNCETLRQPSSTRGRDGRPARSGETLLRGQERGTS